MTQPSDQPTDEPADEAADRERALDRMVMDYPVELTRPPTDTPRPERPPPPDAAA